MRYLWTLLVMLLPTLWAVADVYDDNRVLRAEPYVLINDWHDKLILKRSSDLATIREFAEIPGEGLSYWNVLVDEVEGQFLLFCGTGTYGYFWLLNPDTESFTRIGERYDRNPVYQFNWGPYYVFSYGDKRNLVLDSGTWTISEFLTQDYNQVFSRPDAEGRFWDISNRWTIHEYQFSGSGVVSTGNTSTLQKGDLDDSMYLGWSYEARGVETVAVRKALFDMATGNKVGFHDFELIYTIENGILLGLYPNDGGVALRSLDGSASAVYYSQREAFRGIAETDDAWYVYFYDPESTDPDYEEIRIPRSPPSGNSALSRENVWPISRHSQDNRTVLFPVNETMIGWQRYDYTDGGTFIVLVDVPERRIAASFFVEELLTQPPDYSAATNALWWPGYRLSLDPADAFHMEKRFDAEDEPVYMVNEHLYCRLGSNTFLVDLPSGILFSSDHSNAELDRLLTLQDGRIAKMRYNTIELFANEEAFRQNSFQVIENAPATGGEWKANAEGSIHVNQAGTIIRNGDFLQPAQCVPFHDGWNYSVNSYAASTDKIFRIDWETDPQSGDRIQWLNVWNADGTQLHQVALPQDLNPPQRAALDLWVYPLAWELLRSGSEVYLIGRKFTHELFIFDLDESTGTIIDPDDSIGARVQYDGWYDAYQFDGFIYPAADNWIYHLENGWQCVRETDTSYITWDAATGWVARPKFIRNLYYAYGEGWRYDIEKRDGHYWVHNFEYGFAVDDYPALPPVSMEGRRFLIKDQESGELMESWHCWSHQNASIRFKLEGQVAIIHIDYAYDGPTGPDDTLVRLTILPTSEGISGYYELTFADELSGTVYASLTATNPADPEETVTIQSNGTFTIIRPGEDPLN